MQLERRIRAFSELGDRLGKLLDRPAIMKINAANGWFTPSEINRALGAWSELLQYGILHAWTANYPLQEERKPSEVLVITAGNIPLVGFHDFLSVLVSGNRFNGKLSSRDNILLPRLAEELIRIEPEFGEYIRLEDLPDPEAIIATGSDNSARYFRTLFGHLPGIIRKNRSSLAILGGDESPEELDGLAADMVEYYGLGCRSVSHVYLPAGFPVEILSERIRSFSGTDPCPLHRDNLRYQKARLSLLGIRVTDAQNALLTENPSLHSPIGIAHYSHYQSLDELVSQLDFFEGEIQCKVGKSSILPGMVPFGKAQKPGLDEYADRVDTLEFLSQLS